MCRLRADSSVDNWFAPSAAAHRVPTCPTSGWLALSCADVHRAWTPLRCVCRRFAEWRLALELEQRGRGLRAIFPIFVGEPPPFCDLYVDNFFQGVSPLKLPTTAVHAVEELVSKSLRESADDRSNGRNSGASSEGAGAPLDATAGVKRTFARLTEFQGVKMLGERTTALENIVREVRSAVDAAAVVAPPTTSTSRPHQPASRARARSKSEEEPLGAAVALPPPTGATMRADADGAREGARGVEENVAVAC
jgi:hypothetical protein